MPRQRLPVQYFADILAELQGVNERLDTLIAGTGPQTYVPADPPAGAVPEPVRLEEPSPAGTGDDEGIDVENDAPTVDIRQHGRCQELTARGNVCGRKLPCRYHDAT